MLKFGHRFFRPAVLMTATLWTLAGTACNVPVFRYALEQWEADPYEIVLFHRDALTAEQHALWASLEQAGMGGCLANVTVSLVQLTGEALPAKQTLWGVQDNPTLPWMVVRYPRLSRTEKPAWAGTLTGETVRELLDSPVRKEIAQKLLSGDSVVWLLLEGGDPKLDAQAEQLIETETQKLQQTLKLPEPSPQDPPISADLPLRISFSSVRVARSDPAERLLVSTLLNRDSNLPTTKEPMLFPVFGRGRVIPPAIGKEIRPEAIREMAEFLTGPCSCQVKEMNPGYDLLLSANWTSLVGYQEVMLPEPPPLVSMSQFAAVAASNVTEASAQARISMAPGSPPSAKIGPEHLVRNLVAVIGIGVAFLIATTFVLKVRANRGGR